MPKNVARTLALVVFCSLSFHTAVCLAVGDHQHTSSVLIFTLGKLAPPLFPGLLLAGCLFVLWHVVKEGTVWDFILAALCLLGLGHCYFPL
jgi:hypothetical protein